MVILMDRLSTKGQMIDQIDLRNVPHSGFDRSNHNYGTGKMGKIIPMRLDEVYPGDRIKGRPQIVTNFEPLAAPLMGSMVQKQESFFVPYIQLWRHAYKFFTGKNGFNSPMPSISPFDIYRTLKAPFVDVVTVVETLLSYFRSAYTDHYHNPFSTYASDQDLFNCVGELEDILYNSLLQIYGPKKMLDLVLPIHRKFKTFYKSDYVANVSRQLEDTDVSFDTKVKLVIGFCIQLSQLVQSLFDFFFGPSSIFDYLGWPTPVINQNEFSYPLSPDGSAGVAKGSFITSNFVYASFDSHTGSILAYTDQLFSKVPLVFNPFKAYYLIWYWNYRDQLLETDILDPEEDEFLGDEITENVIIYCCMLRQRCWFKDTFTTALTNTGDGNFLVPTGTDNGGTGVIDYQYYDDNNTLQHTSDQQEAIKAGAYTAVISYDNLTYKIPSNYLSGSLPQGLNSEHVSTGYISLDLFDRIKRLRTYVQKRLILGYEVDDVVYSSFMVRMSNVRMHIPELLGQGRDSVQMNTIVNNTSTDQQIAGDKTATAWSHGTCSELNYFSEEWGLYLHLSTVMPIQSYAGGMQRLYLKLQPLDYMWPEFATMGMDAVYNCELASMGSRLSDTKALQVFGYQGRYYDLKSRQDEEHGRLLTDLNYLTFSREWDNNNPPMLNYMFVHCWPRLDGFVVEDELEDILRYDCYNASAWERRLPVPSEIVG